MVVPCSRWCLVRVSWVLALLDRGLATPGGSGPAAFRNANANANVSANTNANANANANANVNAHESVNAIASAALMRRESEPPPNLLISQRLVL